MSDFSHRELILYINLSISIFCCFINNLAASDEFLIDTGIVYSPAPGNQSQARIASNGTNYLVVWKDSRQGSKVFGSLVSREGEVLNPSGVCLFNDYPSWLDVSSDGDNYLVVWRRSSGGLLTHGRRLDRNGNIIDSVSFLVANPYYSGDPSKILYGGDNYFLVCHKFTHPQYNSIHGVLISPSGFILDTVTISSGEINMGNPAAAFDGENYFVLWEQGPHYDTMDLYAARVSKDGILVDTQSIPLITDVQAAQSNPVIAFDGTNFCVAWNEKKQPAIFEVLFSRISPSGTVLDPGGIRLAHGQNHYTWVQDVKCNGSEYIVLWENDSALQNIWGAKIFLSGDILLTDVFIAHCHYADFVSDPETNFAVWEYNNGIGTSIRGRNFLPAIPGIDTSAFLISSAANYQQAPAAASVDNSYMVAWQELRDTSGFNIYATRIDIEGNNLHPDRIALATDTGDQKYPVIASGEESNLVIWEDKGIKGALLSHDGVILENNILISPGGRDPALTFDGANFLAVWSNNGIAGKRIDQKGKILDGNEIVISNRLRSRNPCITFGKSNYLVVWSFWCVDT